MGGGGGEGGVELGFPLRSCDSNGGGGGAGNERKTHHDGRVPVSLRLGLTSSLYSRYPPPIYLVSFLSIIV